MGDSESTSLKTYKRLLTSPLPNQEMSFHCEPLSGHSHCYLGIDMDRQPCLLLNATTNSSRPSPPMHLEHLVVTHAARCRFRLCNDNWQEGAFSIIRCIDADDQMASYFVRIVDIVINACGEELSHERIARIITIIAQLFRSMGTQSVKSISGLWAELMVIAESSSPDQLIDSWHFNSEDLFDFAFGLTAVEVKATQQTYRTHRFRYEQLRPNGTVEPIIASTMLRRTEAGESIVDLIGMIFERLHGNEEYIEKLIHCVAGALGASWRELEHIRFDYEWASESLRFYNAKDVPSIPGEIPRGVTDIHFCVDLEDIQPLERATMIEGRESPLLESLQAIYWGKIT